MDKAAEAEKQPLNYDQNTKEGQRLYPEIQNPDTAPVVIVTKPEVVDTLPPIVRPPPPEKPNVCPAIGLSCFVFWCCPGCLLPFAAFIFASIAAFVKNHKTASTILLASLGLSIAGIVCGAIGYTIIAVAYIAERDRGLNQNH